MFELNGYVWHICFVEPDDSILFDYHNYVMSIAVTDFLDRTIYIANNLSDDLLLKVLKHEIYHCYEFSRIAYDLPWYYEEMVADFVATYGEQLIDLAYDLFDQIKTYY